MEKRMLIRLAVTAVASLCATSVPVSARTIVAGAGKAAAGSAEASFNNANGIVYNSSSINQSWVIPLIFDNPGSRTITVRGKVITGGSMSCQAVAIKTDGTLASSSLSVAFPITTGYTSISLSLSSVPSGSVGAVACPMNGPKATLLGVDYLE